jgi:hypothetical protein
MRSIISSQRATSPHGFSGFDDRVLRDARDSSNALASIRQACESAQSVARGGTPSSIRQSDSRAPPSGHVSGRHRRFPPNVALRVESKSWTSSSSRAQIPGDATKSPNIQSSRRAADCGAPFDVSDRPSTCALSEWPMNTLLITFVTDRTSDWPVLELVAQL